MTKALKVMQFTDTHLLENAEDRLRGVDTYKTFKDVVEFAVKKDGKPDFVLLTGDLSQDETKGAYDRVREIAESIGSPIYFLPGNHDDWSNMCASFIDHNEKTNFVFDRTFVIGEWVVILLNSVIPGKIEGLLGEEELTRLVSDLTANAKKNALVVLHHNPIHPVTDGADDLGLMNRETFFETIDRHDNVRAILWGHIHSEQFQRRGNVFLIASPSTCFQFKITPDSFSIDAKPPGYRLLVLKDDGSIDTKVEWLADIAEGLVPNVVLH